MKKSTKEFYLTTDTKNSFGFSVKTAGIDLTQFEKNPIMLWMHGRADNGQRNQILPLGRWEQIRRAANSIMGVPVFDDTDDFALSIYNKVENGTIKMASAGLMPLEWDGTPFKSTCTRSIMQEVSIVDIGANNEALAVSLYNNSGGIINLSTLSGMADPYILNLYAKSWDELDRKGGMKELKAASPELYANKFHEKFGRYPVGYKPGINLSTGVELHSPCILNLAAKSWDELDRQGGLLQLKQEAPDLFRNKFYQQFGKYPNN